MASRMKKMFHRKKDDVTEEPRHRVRDSGTANRDPAIRTSLYESTAAGVLPQTGGHPIKGNDSSVILQPVKKSSFRSLRSRRSSSRGSHYDESRAVAARAPPQTSHAGGSGAYEPYKDAASPIGGSDAGRKRWSRSPLPQEFANMSLGGPQAPMTTVTQTTTTTLTGHQGPPINQTIPPNQPIANISNTIQPYNRRADPSLYQSPVSKVGINNNATHSGGNIPTNSKTASYPNAQQQSAPGSQRNNVLPNTRIEDYDAAGGQGKHDQQLARKKSIPRKQVGTPAQGSHLPTDSTALPGSQIDHSAQHSSLKALPPTPAHLDREARRTEANHQSDGILNRSRPITRGFMEPRDAQDVVNRAKSNTNDTEVVEKVAPAVVHENVTQDIHHIREEVITREVHNHDVFHRILPVVDVEVLPPRHFLPVEGGGLVEVSASEVPGRGQNWVIAETASKIASDQPAPRGHRRFTAREFPGAEGDTVRYLALGGYEKTEQTWVHPPELEQGARLTGQSWPMVFGDETDGKQTMENAIPKSAKRKSPKASTIQASAGQSAAGGGRLS